MEREACPRCGDRMQRPFVSLSRTDNETEICDHCGYAEGIEAFVFRVTPQTEWPVKNQPPINSGEGARHD